MLEIAGGLETVFGLFRQRLEQQAFDSRGDARGLDDPGSDVALADRLEKRHLAVAGEQSLPGEHLVQQGAEREDVGAVIDGLAPRLLG